MPKEIANKTKEEIHYRCKKCGDEIYLAPFRILLERCGIYWNTHKSMTYCKCKALGVPVAELFK